MKKNRYNFQSHWVFKIGPKSRWDMFIRFGCEISGQITKDSRGTFRATLYEDPLLGEGLVSDFISLVGAKRGLTKWAEERDQRYEDSRNNQPKQTNRTNEDGNQPMNNLLIPGDQITT